MLRVLALKKYLSVENYRKKKKQPEFRRPPPNPSQKKIQKKKIKNSRKTPLEILLELI